LGFILFSDLRWLGISQCSGWGYLARRHQWTGTPSQEIGKQAQGKVKQKWGKLTDDDLTQINGQREQLEGLIQERYGWAKDMVRKDVDTWLKSQPQN
jgi:uncharacterized protein YjbJ (UPF0337 family)